MLAMEEFPVAMALELSISWARSALQKYFDLACGTSSDQNRPFLVGLFDAVDAMPDDDERLPRLAMALDTRFDYAPGERVNDELRELWSSGSRAPQAWLSGVVDGMVADAIDQFEREARDEQ
jgi:hypothetical protein